MDVVVISVIQGLCFIGLGGCALALAALGADWNDRPLSGWGYRR